MQDCEYSYTTGKKHTCMQTSVYIGIYYSEYLECLSSFQELESSLYMVLVTKCRVRRTEHFINCYYAELFDEICDNQFCALTNLCLGKLI